MGTWIDSLFQRETLPLMDASLGFSYQKQLAIMNNIANVETPYYKRKVMPEQEFTQTLSEAIEARRDSHPSYFEIGDTPSIDFAGGHYPFARADAGQEWGPERHDENSVVIEKEMSELAKNGMMVETLQKAYKKKLDSYRDALRDRVV
jgi:flagellar basal-body rod protein FlgB